MVNSILANEEIYGSMIIFIDENGVNKGEMNKRFAIASAREKGLDLVQVSKSRNGQSICKFADAGKMKFEASKSRKEAKPPETKEMMFHINIGPHDLDIKKNKIKLMLEKKCIVKFGITIKGRERAFMNTAKELLQKNVVDFRDIAKWDDPSIVNNSVFVVLKPIKEITHAERIDQPK